MVILGIKLLLLIFSAILMTSGSSGKFSVNAWGVSNFSQFKSTDYLSDQLILSQIDSIELKVFSSHWRVSETVGKVMWKHDEIRREKPTPQFEAKGESLLSSIMHIVVALSLLISPSFLLSIYYFSFLSSCFHIILPIFSLTRQCDENTLNSIRSIWDNINWSDK